MKSLRTPASNSNLASNSPEIENSPIGAKFENTDPQKGSAHLYVTLGTAKVKVLTNFPEKLPVLNSEVAIIRGYMGELVNSILANDNESE